MVLLLLRSDPAAANPTEEPPPMCNPVKDVVEEFPSMIQFLMTHQKQFTDFKRE